jgi:cytochrome c-type biogenesis protein CcmH/NrfG
LAYSAVGRPREAAESLWAAARRGPPSAELLYQLAKAQRAAGREGAAIEAARQALATDADHVASRELLASMEAASGPAAEVLRR